MLLNLVLAASAVQSHPQDFCCPAHLYLQTHNQTAQSQPHFPLKDWPKNKPHTADPKESNLTNLRQLTFGGQNAEAYWNVQGTKIVFQTRQPEYPDEQIFVMDADGSNRTLISTGFGRTTCSYFSPDGRSIYFSSTHEVNRGAQAPLDMSKGYVWKVNPEFSLYRKELASGKLEKLIDLGDYVAEATIDPKGRYITFTANKGDIDIFRADLNGKNITPLATEIGYDGGPFVSWDGEKIVYRRAPAFTTDQERTEYQNLLKDHLVRPSRMDLWIMDADGSNKKKVTDLGGASFAPFLHPDGKRIIFSSNHHDPRKREFDLFIINIDGTNLRQITFTPDFDGFPMFTRDGKKLIWASNRHGSVAAETNIFTADWVD